LEKLLLNFTNYECRYFFFFTTATSSSSQIFITQSNLSPFCRSHCLTNDIGTVVLNDDLLLEFNDNVVSSPTYLLVFLLVFIHDCISVFLPVYITYIRMPTSILYVEICKDLQLLHTRNPNERQGK
jgi:hypothetical protein